MNFILVIITKRKKTGFHKSAMRVYLAEGPTLVATSTRVHVTCSLKSWTTIHASVSLTRVF
jgi:hypothetical protein